MDEIGTYNIDGNWFEVDGTVSFLKHYNGQHSVNYKGKLSTDSRTICGKYFVEGGSNRFEMSLHEPSS